LNNVKNSDPLTYSSIGHKKGEMLIKHFSSKIVVNILFLFLVEAKSGRMQKSRKRKPEKEKQEVNGYVDVKMVD